MGNPFFVLKDFVNSKSAQFLESLGRKIIVTGHYGSGKTEFSVSLAMLLAMQHSLKMLHGGLSLFMLP